MTRYVNQAVTYQRTLLTKTALSYNEMNTSFSSNY